MSGVKMALQLGTAAADLFRKVYPAAGIVAKIGIGVFAGGLRSALQVGWVGSRQRAAPDKTTRPSCHPTHSNPSS